jgi:Pin2-interacting protein X1
MKSHLKVSQKLDMLGVGAQHTKDPNGLAWKQNRDFERLLARLNGAETDDATVGTNVDGFSKATEVESDAVVEAGVDEDEERRARKERKREKRKAKELASVTTEGDGEVKKKKKKNKETVEEVVVEEVVVQAAPIASSSRGPPRGYVSILSLILLNSYQKQSSCQIYSFETYGSHKLRRHGRSARN